MDGASGVEQRQLKYLILFQTATVAQRLPGRLDSSSDVSATYLLGSFPELKREAGAFGCSTLASCRQKTVGSQSFGLRARPSFSRYS